MKTTLVAFAALALGLAACGGAPASPETPATDMPAAPAVDAPAVDAPAAPAADAPAAPAP